jgi:hypothetical protein
MVIYMYWNEHDHQIAHFHVRRGGQHASVSTDGVLLAGRLDARAYRLVSEWARLHHEEIQGNWERARQNGPLLPVAPLQ